jgi:hypothetical protein
MGYIIIRIDYHKSILRVLNSNTPAFEGKTELTSAITKYAAIIDQMSGLASGLVYPVTFVRRERIIFVQQLRESLHHMSDNGCILAKKLKDEVLLSKMKEYRLMSYKLSAYKLYESAYDIADALEAHLEEAPSVGFTPDEVVAFRAQATQLADSMSEIRDQLDERRNNWLVVRTLLRECTSILRDQFDPFVRVNAKTFPDLAAGYNLQRRAGAGRKKRKPATDETAEIQGRVTNALTGEPLPEVTLTIADFNLVEQSDESGYYTFEELPSSVCRIGAYLPGYEVPAEQTVSLNNGESLEINFVLVPVTVPEV